MRNAAFIGILLLALGLLSFLVPIPRREDHSVKIGDSKIGLQTEHNEKLPPAVGAVLIVGGIVVLAASGRKG